MVTPTWEAVGWFVQGHWEVWCLDCHPDSDTLADHYNPGRQDGQDPKVTEVGVLEAVDQGMRCRGCGRSLAAPHRK